jgi:hypothetical protein
MNAKELIKKLQKFDPQMEIYIDQNCVAPITDVTEGYYVDNNFDGTAILDVAEEDLGNYDLSPYDVKRVIAIY